MLSRKIKTKHPNVTKRYITPAKLPNKREREILTILIEEASEVQKRATKMLRFGRDEVQKGQRLTNARRLGLEVGDFEEMTRMAIDARLFSLSDIADGRASKRKQLAKYMQTRDRRRPGKRR